jgi:general stress protein CsbA
MKKYLLSAAPLLPLVIVIALAVGGITMNPWVYVILALVCPVAAGIIWYMYKDTEKKMNKSL